MAKKKGRSGGRGVEKRGVTKGKPRKTADKAITKQPPAKPPKKNS